jgi:hypothetical protein
VYPVNPKAANALRTAAGAKTDQMDAYVLAKTGRFGLADLHRLTPESSTVQELKTLTRDQASLVEMQTRLVTQLMACLKDYYPVALQVFCTLQQACTLRFLQAYPTPQAAASASGADLAATLRQGKYPKADTAAAKMVETLHRPPLTASEVTVRAKSRRMLSLVKQLAVVLEDIATSDKEIARLFLSHADTEIWSALPGAGKRLAPRLLAEWGDDRSRSGDANSVQMLAGTAPVAFQSGKYARAHTRFACVKPLRNALPMCLGEY